MSYDVATNNASERWMTEKDVAVMTSLSLSTLQKHRFNGCGIPYSKIGRSVRYKSSDVSTFMEDNQVRLFKKD